MRLVELLLGRDRYAVTEAAVVEVASRVAVTPLSGVPPFVRGVIAVRGELAVAVDLRARLGLPARRALASDHLLVVRTPRRLVGLEVDRVTGLVERPDATPLPAPSPDLAGVVQLPDGLTLLLDLEALLGLDDHRRIDAALAASEAPHG